MLRSTRNGPMLVRMPGAPLTVRRPNFDYPDDLRVAWNPRNQEFAYAANSVSLLMPYAEPYFVRSVRAAIPELEGDLAARATDFVQQESQHHRQHRRFNDLVVAQVPALRPIERGMKRAYGWLGRTRSLRFNLAFAAASETIAFTLARWAEDHLSAFFEGADQAAATMFLWHLAEEVEHKTVAFDVFETLGGSRLRYARAMITSFVLASAFIIPSILVMMAHDRRIFSPVAWFRLVKLALSFVFELLPNMAASCLPGHHPSKFTDPTWLTSWLQTFDPATGTMPEWSLGELLAS